MPLFDTASFYKNVPYRVYRCSMNIAYFIIAQNILWPTAYLGFSRGMEARNYLSISAGSYFDYHYNVIIQGFCHFCYLSI